MRKLDLYRSNPSARPAKSLRFRRRFAAESFASSKKSERVVPSGTPIVVLSNPQKIEIVVDLLSSDAVKEKPGASVIIENWGGPCPLRARVRMVEPYGFTKVSALGIEEQRVNVIADFVDSPEGLGDGYRVDARIVVWEASDVLKIPASALFRTGQAWSVFTIENGRTSVAAVEVGHRNASEAEILKGLVENGQVILHPANDLKSGARVMIGGMDGPDAGGRSKGD